MQKIFYVYIITNAHNSVFYIGLTSNLERRIFEHKNKFIKGFSAKYNLEKLVYYEQHETFEQAYKREKRMKFWLRDWKIELIKKHNPEFIDLYYNNL